MMSEVEELSSWAVEISNREKPSLMLILNGRRVRLPPTTAELLARALHERSLELASRGGGGPANLS
jgi:hypothetical protein